MQEPVTVFVGTGEITGIAMSLIIPGCQVLVTSGDVFSGLTVGAYGASFLRIEVQSGGTVSVEPGITRA